MDLSHPERLLLGYLSQYCPTPNKAGALALGVKWEKPRGTNESHTAALKELMGQDWDQFQIVAGGLRDKGLVGLNERASILECWITLAGRGVVAASSPMYEGGGAGSRSSLGEQIVSGIAALVGVGLIAFVVYRNEPFEDLNIVIMFRGLVALALAVSAATIPGFLLVGWKGWGMIVRAGGALAVFVLSLVFTPTTLENTPRNSRIPPPKALVYEACPGVTDSRLPDDALGRAGDDRTQPRQWMWSAEDNAEKQLGRDCITLWLLTDEFAGSYQEFVAHVNVAAANDVIVSCHLLQPAGAVKRVELQRDKPTPKEGVIHYFLVPESRKGDCLLVFVAMRNATYDAIVNDPKFKITSN